MSAFPLALQIAVWNAVLVWPSSKVILLSLNIPKVQGVTRNAVPLEWLPDSVVKWLFLSQLCMSIYSNIVLKINYVRSVKFLRTHLGQRFLTIWGGGAMNFFECMETWRTLLLKLGSRQKVFISCHPTSNLGKNLTCWSSNSSLMK